MVERKWNMTRLMVKWTVNAVILDLVEISKIYATRDTICFRMTSRGKVYLHASIPAVVFVGQISSNKDLAIKRVQ